MSVGSARFCCNRRASGPCCTAPIVPIWDVASSGQSCLRFTWSSAGCQFTQGYTIQLYNGVAQVYETVGYPYQEITFTGLLPDTAYDIVVTGVCSPEHHSTPVATAGVTFPPPLLGLQYDIVACVPGSSEGLCNLTLQYTDYICVTGFSDPVWENPPPDWAGTITRLPPATPRRWLITGVPYASVMALYLTAEPLSVCNSACGRNALSRRIPAVSATFRQVGVVVDPPSELAVTLTVDVPPEPAPTCSEVALEGLAFDAASSGAKCLAFSWTPQPLFTYGYQWSLLVGLTVVRSGTIPNFTTASILLADLVPSTAYNFELTGRCSASSLGNPVSVEGSTTAACYPLLPAVPSSAVTVTFDNSSGKYVAAIQYSGYTCVNTPILSWRGAPIAGAQIDTPAPPTWTVSGLPPAKLVTLVFAATAATGSSCSSCCALRGSTALTAPFSFTTPAPPVSPCTLQPLTVSPVFVGSTCAQFTWTPPTSSTFPGGYSWQFLRNGTVINQDTMPEQSFSIAFPNLTPDTTYTFALQGICGPGSKTTVRSATITTTQTQTPALTPFVQNDQNTTYKYNGATPTTADVQISFPKGVCVQNYLLQWDGTPPEGSVITNTPNTYLWHITNVPLTVTNDLTMSAISVAGTCANGCEVIDPPVTVTTPVQLVIPAAPPTPGSAAPFSLMITNYAGPPLPIANAGKSLQAATADSPVLQGAGDATTLGSYLNQLEINTIYASQIVDNFVKFHMNKLISVGSTTPYYLAIDTIFFGNASDPASQGLCVPHAVDEGFEASLTYNYADSSSSINPGSDYENFKYPPFLIYFKQLMTYNWEARNGNHPNSSMVRLAFNNYGSKKTNEQWYFNCSIDEDGTVVTTAPSDPKAVDSVIAKGEDSTATHSPYDGNITADYNFAGWNCMERWFMHAAYCNQQLRQWISDGEIQGTAGAAMTLDDLTDDTAPYFQISAITTDGEGNGFTNTLYPATQLSGQPPVYPWYSAVTMAECNLTMKALWDKWMNQNTAAVVSPPSWWAASAQAYLQAPAGRILMPATAFTLPCAMSMTTPGLLKNMSISDLGTPDADGVSNIFHEIYDTSDSTPFYYLGANPASVTNCTPGGGKLTGTPFSADVQSAANPTSASLAYAKNPEQYTSKYGTWDNLILPSDACAGGALAIQSDGSLINDPELPGSYTAFNDSSSAICARMNTSQYDPWAPHSTATWILTKTTETPEDYESLGWALESSRYDLYNGAWASAAQVVNGGDVDYSDVRQGQASADGALVWSDLSTGLKPRVASIMTAVNTVASASGQVWMLSCQGGPFVNCKGVRASQRAANETVGTSADFLTFMSTVTTWPGWPGMRGQWWGVGTNATAGVQQRWALDQMYLGLNVPAPDVINPTNSSEDNFGVFADFNIQVAAWAAMANDLQGLGLNPNGVSNAAGIKYSPDTTGVPKCGCYELAYLPLSWFSTSPQPPP